MCDTNHEPLKHKMQIYEGNTFLKSIEADFKNQRFFECITFEIGGLRPLMKAENVLQLQE